MEVISKRTPKARKPHRCDSCGRAIQTGERHYAQACKDGDFYTFRSHTACFRAAHIIYFAAGPHAYDGCLPLVSDMEPEDREIIAAEDQDVYIAIWGAG